MFSAMAHIPVASESNDPNSQRRLDYIDRQTNRTRRPCKINLGLRPFVIRIGISTGDAVLGNVGTYDVMGYIALGTTTNLGARLEAAAERGFPCISRRTCDEIRGRFRYREGSPRAIIVKGLEELGEQQVSDVAGVVSQ
jgi:class 3 adenylate cyclase